MLSQKTKTGTIKHRRNSAPITTRQEPSHATQKIQVEQQAKGISFWTWILRQSQQLPHLTPEEQTQIAWYQQILKTNTIEAMQLYWHQENRTLSLRLWHQEDRLLLQKITESLNKTLHNSQQFNLRFL